MDSDLALRPQWLQKLHLISTWLTYRKPFLLQPTNQWWKFESKSYLFIFEKTKICYKSKMTVSRMVQNMSISYVLSNSSWRKMLEVRAP